MNFNELDINLAYGISIYLFQHSYNVMCGCVGWSAPLFIADPNNISNGFTSYGEQCRPRRVCHMHSLVIASTAGLYKMINFIYLPCRKTIGFSSKTGADPLKNHKVTKPALNVGLSLVRQRNAI